MLPARTPRRFANLGAVPEGVQAVQFNKHLSLIPVQQEVFQKELEKRAMMEARYADYDDYF